MATSLAAEQPKPKKSDKDRKRKRGEAEKGVPLSSGLKDILSGKVNGHGHHRSSLRSDDGDAANVKKKQKKEKKREKIADKGRAAEGESGKEKKKRAVEDTADPLTREKRKKDKSHVETEPVNGVGETANEEPKSMQSDEKHLKEKKNSKEDKREQKRKEKEKRRGRTDPDPNHDAQQEPAQTNGVEPASSPQYQEPLPPLKSESNKSRNEETQASQTAESQKKDKKRRRQEVDSAVQEDPVAVPDAQRQKKKRKHDKDKQAEIARLEPIAAEEAAGADKEPTNARPSSPSPVTAHAERQVNRVSARPPVSIASRPRASATKKMSQPQPEITDRHFEIVTFSMYLPVPPVCFKYPLNGICASSLSPLLLTYHPELGGIVLTYNNVRLSSELPSSISEKRTVATTGTTTTDDKEDEDGDGDEDAAPATPPRALAKAIDIYGESYIWVTADYLVFAPQRGQQMDGHVTVQTEGHIGIVVYNLFSASIAGNRIPKDWKWIETGSSTSSSHYSHKSTSSSKPRPDADAASTSAPQQEEYTHEGSGHWTDSTGAPISSLLRFRIANVELPMTAKEKEGVLMIRGTLLEEEAEEQLRTRERNAAEKRFEKALKAPGRERKGAWGTWGGH